jgi:hypothetical protein
MPKLGECKFCLKQVYIEQEDFNSYIVVCEGGCEFYLKSAMSGPTSEEAKAKYDAFLLELELGGEIWGSKIRDGVTED